MTLQIIREFHGLQETFAADDATASTDATDTATTTAGDDAATTTAAITTTTITTTTTTCNSAAVGDGTGGCAIQSICIVIFHFLGSRCR